MKELPSMTNESIEDSSDMVSLCSECQNGLMHLQHITYFTWLNDELITVPNFPAWVCDVCGRREYDTRAVTWINTLLNPEARQRSSKQRRESTGGPKRTHPKPGTAKDL